MSSFVSSLKLCVLVCLLLSMYACSLIDTKKTTPIQAEAIDWPTLSEQLTDLSHWDLLGKVNIRTPDDSLTAAINSWKQRGDAFSIDLSSTFMGLGATNVSGSSHFVTLIESGEEPLISDQPDELIATALGLPLPITNLQYWLKAIPLPNFPADIKFNKQGLPRSMEQEGWLIEFSRYTFEHLLPLPGKIKLSRNQTRITLAIKQWTVTKHKP